MAGKDDGVPSGRGSGSVPANGVASKLAAGDTRPMDGNASPTPGQRIAAECAGPATAALIEAMGDGAWRVREMAAKVVARHRVGEALDAVAALRDDPVPRVRAAAARAVVVLTASRA